MCESIRIRKKAQFLVGGNKVLIKGEQNPRTNQAEKPGGQSKISM